MFAPRGIAIQRKRCIACHGDRYSPSKFVTTFSRMFVVILLLKGHGAFRISRFSSTIFFLLLPLLRPLLHFISTISMNHRLLRVDNSLKNRIYRNIDLLRIFIIDDTSGNFIYTNIIYMGILHCKFYSLKSSNRNFCFLIKSLTRKYISLPNIVLTYLSFLSNLKFLIVT